MLFSRRNFLKLISGGILGSAALGGYAFAYEPVYRLAIKKYHIRPKNWTAGLRLRVALLADFHACDPWMSAARIEEIVDETNKLDPDLTLLLGDYVSGMRLKTKEVPADVWAGIFSGLKADLGVYSILGNHDWWEDSKAQQNRQGPPVAQVALENVGIPVLENQVVKLQQGGEQFWLAGLGDQLAFTPSSRHKNWSGRDDLEGTVSKLVGGLPVILMAHEPDIFPKIPADVAVTVSGHTHGGQVRLFGYSPVVPSRFGNRFAYGHIEENGRHLIVSGGLGCSILPVRFGSVPEIVLLELGDGVVA